MPPPPNPHDRYDERGRGAEGNHPLASHDPYEPIPSPHTNWWGDKAGTPEQPQLEPEMRVLPDGSVLYKENADGSVHGQRSGWSAMLTVGVVGSLAVLFLALVIGSTLAARVNGGFNPQKRKAIGACHQYVQVRIGATTPSTMSTDYSEGSGYGPWQIQGTVEGANAAGQPVKARYDCTVDARADHTTWRLTKLDLI